MTSPRLSLLALLAAALGGVPCAQALETRNLRKDAVDYRIVTLDLRRDALEAHWLGADGQPFATIDALRSWGQAQGRRLLFATNAGIYDREFRPLGLYVEDGRTLRALNTAKGNPGSGNFSIQPNGVFAVDRAGRAQVVATGDWKARGIEARLATQSGPMLVVDGAINPAFDEASDSRKWRSGVCARTPDEVVFAVSQSAVTFHAFARVFRDDIGCRDALYLDGTLSRVYVDGEGYAGAPPMMVKPYAAMLAVFADPAKPRAGGDGRRRDAAGGSP